VRIVSASLPELKNHLLARGFFLLARVAGGGAESKSLGFTEKQSPCGLSAAGCPVSFVKK
jgi:hypothetical protein